MTPSPRKTTCPCTIFPHLFKKFSHPPSYEGNQNLLLSPSSLKKKTSEEGGGTCGVQTINNQYNYCNTVFRKSGLMGQGIVGRISGFPVQPPPDLRLCLRNQPLYKARSDLRVKYVRMQ